ncbi:rhomboid-related protein 4-like isoform X2 [Biomphalaria pfeifferi]|uniref:Rhomboid-related protein 4-like isoform X2 n=1 Tax=Biomphalaria pfeifferi TaxID=112525 RepID=A0AAD8AS56_BIOPF|nr:rhomboid-related protein 4-like isoform X2 [Biomphalaria pfeifferi]
MAANPRGRGAQWGTILLGSQLMHVGLQNVPPVTLALIVGQTLVFLEAFPEVFPSPLDVCMSSYLVFRKGEWIRMLKGSVYHGDDMHLYFNMLSLLYKGSILEKTYGSPYYAYMITTFTGLTSATYVGLGLLLSHLTGDESYLSSCAVGFSGKYMAGVLFAMKVLVTLASPPGVHYIGNIPVPSKYIFWVELFLIQMAAPNASFVGHLAGILVGLAYAKGPLKYIMDLFLPSSIYRHNSRGGNPRFSSRRYFSSSGVSGYSTDGNRRGYRSEGIRRGLFSRLFGNNVAYNNNDSRDPQYSSEDYRRNPTFETNSIFNQEPPNLHDPARRARQPSPQFQRPSHRSDDNIRPGYSSSRYRTSSTYENPYMRIASSASSAHSHTNANPRTAYYDTHASPSAPYSYTQATPTAPYSSEDQDISSQGYRDDLYTGFWDLSNLGDVFLSSWFR